MSELEGYLEEYIFTDAKSVIVYIYKQYKVRYSLSGVPFTFVKRVCGEHED